MSVSQLVRHLSMSNNYTISNNTIKSWAEADRPREKLMSTGKNALKDAELLAILIGSGNSDDNAVQLCEKILASVENNLSELGKCSLSELQKFKGIGEAKAITIMAALELGRRRQFSDSTQRTQIKCARDAYEHILRDLIDLNHEEFWIIILNRANNILAKICVSRGGVSATVVDAKQVFKPAIEKLASSIVLLHNHPSGNLQPSTQDIELTKKLKKAGEVLDVTVIDHLIVTNGGFYSFAEAGMM